MIRVSFRMRQGQLIGFSLTGHAEAGPAGEDIVCAAVSSAAYMTANTVTDVLHVPAQIAVEEGHMELSVPGDPTVCQAILSGFRLHILALQDQYPAHIGVTDTTE